MKKLKLIFGTHNSRPVGSTDEEFERAYRNAYKPFLSVLYTFPDIPAVMHFSGTLLQWLETHHAEFLDVLAEMSNRKQIELLGGGFYDPVLPLIPISDRIGQIESLTTFLRKRFGRRPRGGWVAERVWEPSLASSIKNSGMDYVFLDDSHFAAAGVEDAGLNYPCQTEDQGKSLVVFPISNRLRRMTPYRTPDEAIAFLSTLASADEERVAVLLDDGEKFGEWDGTSKLCYEEKWLERFFTLVRRNSGWIETILPGRYLRQYMPRRKIYFPCTSYSEMMSWTLTPEHQRELSAAKTALEEARLPLRYVSGGHFRQFLTKYPESNLLYSKMMYTHILVNQLRGDKYRKIAARDELWRGQCSAAYWHGRCGGLYVNRLRKEAYRSLIEAEKVTREQGVFIPSIIPVDFDMDGRKEYLYQGNEINAYVHTSGGVLFELDYLAKSWNYLDTLSRHQEAYHDESVAGRGYDRYQRKAFIDHVLSPDTTIDEFDAMTYRELGSFIDAPYVVPDLERERNELSLSRTGSIDSDGVRRPLAIEKRYTFNGTGFTVRYILQNPGISALSFVFGCEINLSLGGTTRSITVDGTGSAGDGTARCADSCGKQVYEDVGSVVLEDSENLTALRLAADTPFSLWSLTVETVSGTMTGCELSYQSNCLVPRWKIELAPGAVRELELSLVIQDR